jgi:hypothetical protein
MAKPDRMADGPGRITMLPAGGVIRVLDPGPGELGSALFRTEYGSAGVPHCESRFSPIPAQAEAGTSCRLTYQ